jgi:hypothetical protein
LDTLVDYNVAVLGDWWGISVLIMVWIITFSLLAAFAKQESFVAATFITWITAMLLWGMGAIGWTGFGLVSVVLVGAGFWVIKTTSD